MTPTRTRLSVKRVLKAAVVVVVVTVLRATDGVFSALVIVVADSSKLGVVTFARICPLDSVNVVVTDSRAQPEQLAALEEAHVEVVVAGHETGKRRPAQGG